ncbi:DUF4157 domain-containing protein [Coleofasciculus sp. FACHB-SPT36]|uniref:eCIS core domain-containing protein n=1 Tax=Cyanophyceae TaxID=3028117 RepID=UPI00168BE5A7|nr:DUF4157 domain-containing protein [Coleofasciculus sp. FACHB-SPT36]MBD2541007.1 DUF4157 domain-containing protein [Coleofasciculus sp. FACHB-SPT36]
MAYERVSKRSSGNSHIHKKDSRWTTPAMPVQAKPVSASPQEQELPSYTPLPANWATNNNLMRSLSGAGVVQRQEELGKEELEPIQAKLTIGQPGDKYEQEADQTSQQVVNQINAPVSQQSSQGETLQREEMPEDEELQMKPASGTLQREEMPEDEDEELQMKPASSTLQREEMPEDEELQMQRKSDSNPMAATPDLEASIQQAKGGGQPLADNIREPMEQAFGADFSGVNIHTDAQSDQLNQSIQAKAFTTGQDVFFRQGAYDPGSRGGQELIAHELTHVVQQSGSSLEFNQKDSSEIQRQEASGEQEMEPVQRSPHGVPQVQADLENQLNSSKDTQSPLLNANDALTTHGLTHIVQQTGTSSTLQREYDTSAHLPTSASLTTDFQSKKQMGRAKFWRLGKANADLEKVFGALNEYQGYLNGYEIIGPTDFELENQVENLQRSLRGVISTSERYARKRPSGKKTPQIKELGILATDILKKLTVIGSNPTKYLGLAWKKMLVVSGGDLTEFQQKIDLVANHVSEFEADETAINQGVKQLDPEIAAAIEKTNKGIKTGKNEQGEPVDIRQIGGIAHHEKGALSGSYLVPDGFFKPFSQSPVRNNAGLAAGYQNFREVLAYKISKYIEGLFKELGIDRDLGVAKTGFAALSSEKFAEGGKSWNAKMAKNGAKAVPKAEMPEQVGIWQERLDISEGAFARNIDLEHVDPLKTQRQVQQIAFFDLMTGNYDRHGGNLAFDRAGNLRPIDHGEILPNFDLYEEHNCEKKEGEGGIESKFAWSRTGASRKIFSDDFRYLVEAIDPGKVISDLKKIAAQTSLALGVEKLTHRVISEESWQIMHLHLVALKEGIMAGLSPQQLAIIFAKGYSATRDEQGEMYQTMVKLNKNHGIERKNRTQSNEFTQKELEEAEEKVKQAIQNGKKRLRPDNQPDPNAKD